MSDNYRSAVVCTKGCVRGNNEDSFCFLGEWMPLEEMDAGAHILYSGSREKQAYAIFDGMGGGDSGEIAASTAAELFSETQDSFFGEDGLKALERFARNASVRIAEGAKKKNAAGEGSTFAGLIIRDGQALVCNVGDSRVYLVRKDALELVTRDHSHVYEMYLAGKLTLEQARKHPRSNVITHYLGMDQTKIGEDFIYSDSFKLYDRDRFMLCSDGVSDLISHSEILEVLKTREDPDEAACELISRALEYGGKDNATCIVVDIQDSRLKQDVKK